VAAKLNSTHSEKLEPNAKAFDTKELRTYYFNIK
jgi:hypothetical protein